MNYKMIVTDTHVFFLTGPYSNWHITPFEGRLEQDGEIYLFNCGEQYLMASKAHMFGDQVCLDKLMAAKHPRDQKSLGRSVQNFDKEIWDQHARNIMFRGCWYKFHSVNEYSLLLMSHYRKHIVEGNPKDSIWGVGLAWDDPAILDPANWDGTNWLGETHMEVGQQNALLVAAAVQASETDQKASYNMWTKEIEVA